jgi:glycerate 2-kinase
MSIAELKKISVRIQRAVLSAVDPFAAVTHALARTPHGFRVQGREFDTRGRLVLIAAGKASEAMARAARDVLGPAAAERLVVIPQGYPSRQAPEPGMRVMTAGHPLPDENGLAAAGVVSSIVQGLGAKDTCLFLISGGSSSMLPSLPPGVSLHELVETTTLLLKCGADIRELNAVRKHLGGIGGGRLARSCRGTVVTLAISDVVGDDLSVIGSGPTVPDSSTFADALGVLARYGLTARAPRCVVELLEKGSAGRSDETPRTLPARHAAFVIASSALALQAAAAEARACGFAPLVLTSSMTGEAREAGTFMASVAREVSAFGRPVAAPACILAAGETTVTVKGNGTGGRNQEIALAAALGLRDRPGILLTSFATDGKEGNSNAAGAYASGATVDAGQRAGLDARSCLSRNDAHAFLAAAGDLISTGPTGTNVNDVSFALVEQRGDALTSPDR